LLFAGQPVFAGNAYETVGRRFTFLPLTGFSSDDGIGGGFRLARFDYDGETVPYRRSFNLQGFFTAKGKWAHQLKADFPEITSHSRLEFTIRYDKEETANYFGDLTDADLAVYTSDEQTYEQVDPYLTIRWILDLQRPWRLQVRLRTGTTLISSHTSARSVIDALAPLGYEGGYLLQLGTSLRYDTRDDYTNSTQGRLDEVGVEWSFGADGDFNGGELILEHRHFRTVARRLIFAQRFLANYTMGDIPFYERPKLGSSKTLRGLSADRLRDDARILANTELRWMGMQISGQNHMFAGMNVFADVGQVFPRSKMPSSGDWELGLGFGIRVYWYSTVVRADLGRSNGGTALYTRFSQIF